MQHKVHWCVVFADVVVRAVEALDQYKRFAPMLPMAQRYEATLTLSVAQTVVGAVSELSNAMERQGMKGAPDLDRVSEFLTVDEHNFFVRASPSDDLVLDGFGGRELLTHLRDAMAHPVPCTAPDGRLPTTGYVSVPDIAGNIAGFEFVSSPWVDLQDASKNVGRAIIKSPHASVKLAGAAAKRAVARERISGAMDKFQKQRDRGLYLHEEGNRLSIRLEGSDSDYVPFVRLSASVAGLAGMCAWLASNYQQWLDTVAAVDQDLALGQLLRMPGVPSAPAASAGGSAELRLVGDS